MLVVKRYDIMLQWPLGHTGITCNAFADEAARSTQEGTQTAQIRCTIQNRRGK